MSLASRDSRHDLRAFPFHTLVDLVRTRGETQPDRVAFHDLTDGDVDGPVENLTSGQLYRESRQVAALVQAAVGLGAHVLLLHPPGLEFVTAFFGCVLAGAVPVPAYPPDPSRLERPLPTPPAMSPPGMRQLCRGKRTCRETSSGVPPTEPLNIRRRPVSARKHAPREVTPTLG